MINCFSGEANFHIFAVIKYGFWCQKGRVLSNDFRRNSSFYSKRIAFNLHTIFISLPLRKSIPFHSRVFNILCFKVPKFRAMSRHMGKPTICLGENKGADQLRSNCEADQRLCFHYSDSTVPLLLKSEISIF